MYSSCCQAPVRQVLDLVATQSLSGLKVWFDRYYEQSHVPWAGFLERDDRRHDRQRRKGKIPDSCKLPVVMDPANPIINVASRMCLNAWKRFADICRITLDDQPLMFDYIV
jgi:hypothetical protein